jgi:hypothetical protein
MFAEAPLLGLSDYITTPEVFIYTSGFFVSTCGLELVTWLLGRSRFWVLSNALAVRSPVILLVSTFAE